ncbi:phosphoesterase [Campylobacter blaseri]|uniref:Phosphoesterase n=1 Tax=Campylobacter blaseri TaxID=2042961 RepID=A0A2P8R0U9_9BACT|nr:phosphatase PAP2 family protein [Campylobacter blaseri]PSM52123.1 phosphoesterase [Campylobacter blaseri]PSM53889.1 phosphoesterase [Campylobacter blaseri]QKF85323.1 phosphoesterase [Campylobacter blaseri]
MILENSNKQLILTAVLFVFTILLFELTNLDILVQNYFYNFETKLWTIDSKNTLIKFFMYDGFKKLFIVFGISILISLLFFRKHKFIKEHIQGLIIVLLSIIFVPLITVWLKDITNMPCPYKIINYGGEYPNIKLFEPYPIEFKQLSRTKCWPAGHASIGFSLMSLYFLFKQPRFKNIALIVALILGWSTGGYKILIGDHFFSHNIITMLLAWMIILIIYKITNLKVKNEKSTKI